MGFIVRYVQVHITSNERSLLVSTACWMCTDKNMRYAYTHTRVAHLGKMLLYRQAIEIDQRLLNLKLWGIFAWTMVRKRHVCGGGMVVVRGRGHVARRVRRTSKSRETENEVRSNSASKSNIGNSTPSSFKLSLCFPSADNLKISLTYSTFQNLTTLKWHKQYHETSRS